MGSVWQGAALCDGGGSEGILKDCVLGGGSQEAQSSQANSPKVSAGFNTVRDTQERGHRRHPTQAPSVLGKAIPLPAQLRGHFASRQAGEAITREGHPVASAGPRSSPTANPEGSSTARGSPPPHGKGKKSGYKKGHGTALCRLPLGGLTTTLPSFLCTFVATNHLCPTTRLWPPCSPLGSGDKGPPGTPNWRQGQC